MMSFNLKTNIFTLKVMDKDWGNYGSGTTCCYDKYR